MVQNVIWIRENGADFPEHLLFTKLGQFSLWLSDNLGAKTHNFLHAVLVLHTKVEIETDKRKGKNTFNEGIVKEP